MTAPRAQIARAEVMCRERGVRLTDQRRRVLEILCAAGRPVGAYEIMDAMREGPRVVAPPTVYRALEFLLEQGLIHKIESLHAFVGCDHPEHPHFSEFLICLECGGVAELKDDAVERSLASVTRESGFLPRRRVVEVMGICARCARKAECARKEEADRSRGPVD